MGGLRAAAHAIAPGGRRGRLSLLLFHRVVPVPDPMRPGEVDARVFARLMAALTTCFRVLPLAAAAQQLRSGTLPSRAVAVTFDDGYADNHAIGLPILQHLGLSATFFVATGFVGGRAMWNDVVVESLRQWQRPELDLTRLGLGRYPTGALAARAKVAGELIGRLKYLEPRRREAAAAELASITGAKVPDDLMMTEDQVRELKAAGMELGGHTVTHPILTRLGAAEARAEIEGGRRALESLIGSPVTVFAYPNGKPGRDYDAGHVTMIRELGFSAAVSTAWGVSTRNTDLLGLRRFTPWERKPVAFCLRLLQNCLRRADADASA
ncbi:MAG: polysaccharide deacetylase family protein [Deferrisomatales bacterium]